MEIKKKGNDFLNNLEGYRQRLKEIHWSTTCKAEHLLTDDICGDIQDYEDKVAEALMGCGDFRYGIGDLKTMSPTSKKLTDLLKELLEDVETYKETLDDKKNAGIINILDDFTENIYTWKYLSTFS